MAKESTYSKLKKESLESDTKLLRSFVAIVQKMRVSQMRHFKLKTQEALVRARFDEAEVDKFILGYLADGEDREKRIITLTP